MLKVFVFLLPAFFVFPQSNDSLTGQKGSVYGKVLVKSKSRIQVASVKNEVCILIYKDHDYSAPESVIAKINDLYSRREAAGFNWFERNNKHYLKDILISGKPAVRQEIMGGKKYEEDKKDREIQSSSLYTKALGAYHNGNYEEAMKLCQAIIVLNPRYDLAQKLAGDINKKLKQREAKAHLEKAVESAGKGKLLEASGEWQMALSSSPEDTDIAREIKKKKEEILEEHNKKAMDLFNQDKLIEAAAEWNVILAIEKDDPVAKKGIETANKRLSNFSSMERVKMEYETNLNAAKKEYEEKNYLAAIQNYQMAVKLASKLNKEKDVRCLAAEIKRIEDLVESSRKIYLDSALRFADAKDWLNMSRELRDCLRIDPGNRQAPELFEKYRTEVYEVRDKLYLDGLEAYGREDIDTAIAKWNSVLILDPSFEKASLNIKKAGRKKVK
ncbi:MAG: hypothetical protein V1752_00980 [Candidatus Firestonebacteria bacterium]